jgi:hypothetical protein
LARNSNGKSLVKKLRIISAVLILLVIISSVFVHPFGNVKKVQDQRPLLHGAQIDPALSSVLERSCRNCHSRQTVWPWYSYVAPASWLIEKDVRDGRTHFDMSRWEEYTPQERSRVLAEISVMVRNHEMPLSRYTVLHPEARLSDQEVQAIDQWGHQERRRVKEADQQAQGTFGTGTGSQNATAP